MADIQITATSDTVTKAVTEVNKLERQIKALATSYSSGAVNQDQYNQGLVEAKRNLEVYSTSSQKATFEVRSYASSVLKAIEADKDMKAAKVASIAQTKASKQAINEEKEANRQALVIEREKEQEVNQATKTYIAYRSSIDDVFAAQQKYNSLSQAIIVTGKANNRTNEETVRQLEELRRKFKEVGVAIDSSGQVQSALTRNFNQFGASVGKTSKSLSRINLIVQQGGYQVQDFFVQVMGGTSALTAFSQQGSQMAGVFGPSGAVVGALIVVGSLLGKLALGFFKAKDAAEEGADGVGTLEDRIKSLRDSLADYQRVQDALAQGLSLGEKDSLDSIKEAQEELAKLVISLEAFKFDGGDTGLIKAPSPETVAAYEEILKSGDEYKQTQEKILGLEQLILDLKTRSNEEGALEVAALAEANALLATKVRFGEESVEYSHAVLQAELDSITAKQKLGEYSEDVAQSMKEQVVQQWELENAGNAFADSLERAGGALSALSGIGNSIDKALAVATAKVNALETGANEAVAGSIAGMAHDLFTTGQTAIEQAKTVEEAMAASSEMFESAGNLEQLQSQLTTAADQREANRESSRSSRRSSGGGSSRTRKEETVDSVIAKLLEEKALEVEILGVNESQGEIYEALGELRDKASDSQIAAAEEALELLKAQEELVLAQIALEEKLNAQRETIANGTANTFGDGLTSIVDGTATADEAFKSMAASIITQLYQILVVQRLVGSFSVGGGSSNSGLAGFIGGLFANGGAFQGGNEVTAFASGGVVDSPTFFGMAGGKAGVMGEAGPEAIMPLSRGSDGKLGVQISGGGGTQSVNNNITMNISTPDAKSFENSRTQTASKMQQAVSVAQRNS